MTLNGNFVAVRVAADDMYPKRSAQEEISAGNGNQESASLTPWKRRASGFNARTDALISSGNFSSGTGAGLMRFTLASSCSSGTVGLKLSSFRRFRRSSSASCLELTNPLGIDVCLRNSCNCAGILEVDAGMSATAAGARVTALFAGTFFFVAIKSPC